MSRGVVGGTGLGFGDVCATMAAIEEHHQVSVDLVMMTTPGSSRRALWSAYAMARPSLASPASAGQAQGAWVVQVEDWGDRERTASSLYGLLLKLDALLTEARWTQLPLP